MQLRGVQQPVQLRGVQPGQLRGVQPGQLRGVQPGQLQLRGWRPVFIDFPTCQFLSAMTTKGRGEVLQLVRFPLPRGSSL